VTTSSISSIESGLRELFDRQARSLGVGEPPPVGELGARRITTLGESGPPQRARRALAVAAATVLVLGAGALWWALDVRGDSTPSGVPAAPLMPVDPPLLLLDVPGWEMQAFDQYDPAAYFRTTDPDQIEDGRTTTFIDPALGVTGPRVTVSVTNSGSTGLDVEEQAVMVGTTEGVLYDNGAEKLVRWHEPAGNRLEAFGWSISVDDLIGAAERMTVDDDGFPVAASSLPLGLTALTGHDAELMHSSVQYTWVDSSGRQLDVNLYPGGPTVQAQRADSCCDDGEQRREVTFQGAAAIVDQSEYLIRMDQLRGFWLWEIDASASLATDGADSFASIDEFLSVAEQIRIVDPVVWRASLADTVVLRSEIPDVVDELSVFPMPPGAPAPIGDDQGFTTTRASVAQDVATQTACAWGVALTDAVAEHDIAAAAGAIGVLRDVAAWDEIGEIPDLYPESEVATIVGRIRAAADLLSPFDDVASFDPEDEASNRLWDEIPVDAVTESLACT
jgi:hypothetical protein